MAKSTDVIRIVEQISKVHLTLRQLLRNTIKLRGALPPYDRNVKIVKVGAVPSTKSVRFDAEAYGSNKYDVTITFYRVNFSQEKDSEFNIPVDTNEGRYFIRKLSMSKNPVKVFCSCPWFRFACEWYLADHGSLAVARKKRPYQRKKGSKRKPVNPSKLPCICKHIYGLSEELRLINVLGD